MVMVSVMVVSVQGGLASIWWVQLQHLDMRAQCNSHLTVQLYIWREALHIL